MQNLQLELIKLLEKDDRFTAEGKLLKNKVIEAALQLDPSLLKLLLSHKSLKKHFFREVDSVLVFDKIEFQKFVSNKSFLKDSYTAFSNKIGLTSDDEFISEGKDVVLSWPHKDCVLEGGQTKEDEKRDEIFWNETLAPDEIDRLLSPKVFTNFKKYDSKGEHKVTDISLEDNLIIKGNNLLALHSLLPVYRGRIKLIYIDPPYNTGNDTFQYNDSFNHSTWLTFMKNRLIVAKELLCADGFIFIQIDDDEQPYLKILLDEIFNRDNFITSICVKMSHLSGVKMAHKEKKIPKIKEFILMYSKNKNLVRLNPEYIEVSWDEAFERYKSFIVKNDYTDEQCNKWKVITLSEAIKKAGINPKDEKESLKFKMQNANNIFRTAMNRSADYAALPKNQFVRIDKGNGQFYFVYNGEDVNFASEKIRMIGGKQVPTSIIGDIWTDIGINNLSNEGGVSLRFGKKPEKLVARIINMTTKEKDIVLDFNLGSGTTAAVSHKLNRRYIGIEQLNYYENDSIVRLKNVINGENVGLGNLINWQGGGYFTYCELAKLNQSFVDNISKANTTKELKQIWESIKKDGFISYKVSPKDIDKNISEFEELSIADQKKFLIEVLDKNHLYVNYSEIDDKDYKISDEDKKLNKKFYSLK